MNNVIELSARRQGKSDRLRRVVEYILSQGQTIVIGTADYERRIKELRHWFPEAKLEKINIGIKVSNG